MRLDPAPDAPIGVAEVIVDDGVGGLQVDRAFEVLGRVVLLAELVMRPAETVDDIAVGRLLIDGQAQHLERLF